MFKRIVISLTLASLMPFAQADPKTIKVFTTLKKADEIIDLQKSDMPNTNIEVFFIDRKQDIMSSMNSHIPAEKFEKWDDEERYDWGMQYVSEMSPKKTLKIMKSTLGVSYMQMFKIDRVPAVLMDDYFVTYGLTLSDSVKSFNKM